MKKLKSYNTIETSLKNKLHIVSFDNPYPPDYGGVIDVYYKLKALKELGFSITLHCFYNKRPPHQNLDLYADRVIYYARNTVLGSLSVQYPYIVSSRINKQLLQNLQEDEAPVLFEGIHTTYPLLSGKLAGRKTIVRQYNAEYVYYAMLAKEEKNSLRKLYYKTESRLLKKYEKKIGRLSPFAAITTADAEIFKNELKLKEVRLLPAFIPNEQVLSQPGFGGYCLYHGNLSVNENAAAVLWLLPLFRSTEIKFIVAGKNPGIEIMEACKDMHNVEVIANPDDKTMQQLVADAHIHLVPSMNKTGIKLKLLNALFAGRHCIANPAAVADDDDLAACCVVADDDKSFEAAIKKLMQTDFTSAHIEKRKALLKDNFDNAAHASLLAEWLR